MVPKLHPKGRSFRGAAAYLLHDKGRADTADRLAWTEVRNLATDDPHVAWKVMAATAMDAERLKKKAGVKATGRKSDEHVLHLTLSWHPDEGNGLGRDEMMRAAAGAIRALKAEDRQAMIVCHNDEPQPHVHLLINRVSPADGRILSSSKEKLNLSRWAEGYEKERGQILCEERVVNNAARDRGEYTRGDASRPRHIYELEAANDNHPRRDAIAKEQRRRDAEAAKRERETKKHQAAAWLALVQRHRENIQELRAAAKRETAKARATVREEFRPRWKTLFQEQRTDMRLFEEREQSLLGRVQNALKAIDFGALVAAGDRRKAISQAFAVFASAGARLEQLMRQQKAEAGRLSGRQRTAESKAARAIALRKDAAIDQQRAAYVSERSSLRFSNDMEKAAVRALWSVRSRERRAAWTFERSAEEQAQNPATTRAQQIAAVAKAYRDGRPPKDDGKGTVDRGHGD